MVKIHEYQYVVNNPNNSQERDIEHNSWNNYIDNIISSYHNPKCSFASLPRNTKVDSILEMTSKKIVIRFYHSLIEETIEHIATLVEKID